MLESYIIRKAEYINMIGNIKKIIFVFMLGISIILIACSSTNINRIDADNMKSDKQESSYEPSDAQEAKAEKLQEENGNYMQSQNPNTVKEEKSVRSSIESLYEVTPQEINKNLLIIGIDARKNEPARADTIMLINMRQDKINLISIPRDTLIKLRGKGTQKINASYAYGGIDLCKASVENLLDAKIDNYIVFNFKAIQKGVDALGGFTVTLPKTIKIRDPELKKCFTLKKGDIKLNGIQTLEYLRYRSDGRGDIGRIYRQQQFIKDLQDSFLKLENVPLIPRAYLAIRDEIKTDMNASHMASFFVSGYRLRNSFEYHTLEGYGKMIDKVSYYVLYKSSINKVKEVLK